MKCQNCNNILADDDRFCSKCGQSRDDLSRPFRYLISDSFFELFDIDGRLSSTLHALLFKPGHLSSCFRAGKRNSFTPPLRMYLVTSVLLFFIMSLIKTDYSNDLEKISFLLLPHGVLETIPKIMVVLLPVYALFLQVFQPGSHYIFNLIFAVHIHIFWYLLFVLFLILQQLYIFIPSLHYLEWILFLYLVIYQLIAIKSFYNISWLKSVMINVLTIGLYLGALTLGLEVAIALQEEF